MRFLETERERYADDGKPPVDWGRYLEVAPGLTGLDPAEREEVLSGRGLDGPTWERAEGYWMLTLALDAHQGRGERAQAFGRACAEQPGAAPAAPETAAEGPTAPEPAKAPTPDLPPAAPALAAPPAPTPAVPTFLRAELPRAPAAVAVAPPPPALHVPVAMPRARPLDSTLDGAPVARPAALPFGHTPAPEYTARLQNAPAAPRPARRDRFDATVAAPEKGPEPALPFGPAGAARPALPELTVEQYATLSADMANEQDPARRTALLERYGIASATALMALHGRWRQRLEADPAAAAAWKTAYSARRRPGEPR